MNALFWSYLLVFFKRMKIHQDLTTQNKSNEDASNLKWIWWIRWCGTWQRETLALREQSKMVALFAVHDRNRFMCDFQEDVAVALVPNAQLASKSVATWRAAKCGRENTFAIMLHRKKRCPCARVPSALVTAWLIRYRSLEPSKKCTAALKFLNYFSAPLSALHVVQRAMPLAANTLHHTCQIKLEGASKPPNRAWIKIWMKFNVLNSNMIQSMIYRDVAWRLLPAM